MEMRSKVYLNPFGKPRNEKYILAERNAKGIKKIGVLSNQKLKADEVLDELVKNLEQDYQLQIVTRHKKLIQSKACPKEIIEDLAAQCDAVIVGVGD